MEQSPSWHKTTGGTIFLSVIGGALIILFAFLLLVSVYAWQLRYGNADNLLSQFSTQFTTSNDLASRIRSAPPVDNVGDIIRQHNPTFGKTDAPITITAFIDFECPFCARSYPVFKEVMDTYGPAIQIVFKHLPLQSIHPRAYPAAIASTCAQEQDAFWPFYDKTFSALQFDDEAFLRYARELNLNTTQFLSCIDAERYVKNIEQDIVDAVAVGAQGTPTYFLNNTKIEGVLTKALWDELILRQLQDL